MLFRGMAIDVYIIMYCNYARETVCCLIHTHLTDVLGHHQTEWHMQEPVPAVMGIEHGQVGRLLIEMNTPRSCP